jgi:DNA-binding transcriptional ArsR family regulator
MDLEARLAAVEERLAALERSGVEPAATPPSRWWLLDNLTAAGAERDGVGGSVAYGGITRTPGGGELVWQAEHAVADVLDTELPPVASVLAALGHPVRLELVRRILLGAHTLAQLQQVPGARTSGQVHHHLRELRSAGLVLAARNHFTVMAERVVPVLVAVAAAAGPGAVPGTALDPKEH